MSVALSLDRAEELVAFPILWSRQWHTTPDAVAVVSEHGDWSYRQLEAVANTIAASILESGVGQGDCVGICVDRSAEAIAAMLGILKIGAVFVPLDPEYPIDRLRYMVADAGIETIVGHACYEASIGSRLFDSSRAPVHWVVCGQDPVKADELCLERGSEVVLEPSDLAYIMYTSGSTGKPKGVEIEHSALAAYCFADIERYAITAADRTLQFSTLIFDIAIEEIFPPLISGGCVVVRPRERAHCRNELSSLVERFEVTAVHLATAYWHEWVDLMVAAGERIPRSIRLMIVTGEKVSVAHYRRWQTLCDHEVLWCNAYGPTEATVSATVFIPDADFDAANMPIGKPLKRYEAYILDSAGQPVQNGETGQLYLGGPALARGYHNRPELTEAAFTRAIVDGQTKRLYRTGDLARWLADGNIDFGGRIDHQIKLGSYRIEPAEIEAAINEHPSVLESLVSYDEVDGKKFLISYVACGSQEMAAAEISIFLRDQLPPYMIPSRWVFVPSFPKTINGKIDRDALPNPADGVVARDDQYEAPRTDLERRMVQLWQEVLNVGEVGIHDDFFLLGGSSLLVTQVVAKLTSQLSVELPVRDFFANPTVATVSKQIESLLGRTSHAIEDGDVQGLRNQLPLIDTDYFPSGSQRLYAVRYQPRRSLGSEPGGVGQGQAVILCHSIAHEYARGYRNLQQLAIQLCKAGHEVLRFDYASTGNSEGDCGALTADRMIQNLLDAKAFLQTRCGHEQVSVVGLRLGATVAGNVPPGTFERTVLWDPVLRGSQFLEMLDRHHRQQLEALTRFNRVRCNDGIDQSYGHRMSAAKRASIANLRLDNQTSRLDPCTVVVTDGWAVTSDEQQWQASQANLIAVADAIRWDDPQFNESAFSSPESFRVIIDCFQNRGRPR